MWEYNYTYPDELYHYGVLGMKWGVRRAAKKGTTYTYKSHTTKKYEKKAQKALAKASKDTKYKSKAKIYNQRAKRSSELDAKEQKIAEKTSVGKAIAISILTSDGFGTKSYQRYKAFGNSEAKSLGKAWIDNMYSGLGSISGTYHRIKKARYIRQDEKR